MNRIRQLTPLSAAGFLVLAAVHLAAQEPSGCEWCGAPEAPDSLTSTMKIADSAMPGPPLIITGTIFAPDGSPAAGVLLYAYHTNHEGIYPKRGDETGNARRHGYLRGWLRTDTDGAYRIETVRPASYPTGTEPAHIHLTLKLPGEPEQWVESIMFDDDRLLTERRRNRMSGRGGSGIVSLEEDSDGILRGRRDIHLDD